METQDYSDWLQALSECFALPDPQTVDLLQAIDAIQGSRLKAEYAGYSVETVAAYRALFEASDSGVSLNMSDYLDGEQAADKQQQLAQICEKLGLSQDDEFEPMLGSLPELLEISALLAQHDVAVAKGFLQHFAGDWLASAAEALRERDGGALYAAMIGQVQDFIQAG
ncbi:hypothetical protein [Paraferrimonas sedimenticola]|uniref:Chaperone TorD involved in molybdoenzyme TorA maturation n=1 Tax=Paraferrimonas sedimenticola TaxID=375674 RepID=A0AA37RXM6_9GAMM|nr:hypothetical protein [Paraferrimonas sedimenticola]GLP97263.1 hypothetical protein GCM10007895_25700 [Paraferrimonas sedimenticola]